MHVHVSSTRRLFTSNTSTCRSRGRKGGGTDVFNSGSDCPGELEQNLDLTWGCMLAILLVLFWNALKGSYWGLFSHSGYFKEVILCLLSGSYFYSGVLTEQVYIFRKHIIFLIAAESLFPHLLCVSMKANYVTMLRKMLSQSEGSSKCSPQMQIPPFSVFGGCTWPHISQDSLRARTRREKERKWRPQRPGPSEDADPELRHSSRVLDAPF